MNTAQVVKINGAGTYNSPNGLLYKFEYELSNGVILTANHKTQTSPFKDGDTVEYVIKGTNDFGSWGSVSNQKTCLKQAHPHKVTQHQRTNTLRTQYYFKCA
jgi:hypothetical protein